MIFFIPGKVIDTSRTGIELERTLVGLRRACNMEISWFYVSACGPVISLCASLGCGLSLLQTLICYSQRKNGVQEGKILMDASVRTFPPSCIPVLIQVSN